MHQLISNIVWHPLSTREKVAFALYLVMCGLIVANFWESGLVMEPLSRPMCSKHALYVYDYTYVFGTTMAIAAVGMFGILATFSRSRRRWFKRQVYVVAVSAVIWGLCQNPIPIQVRAAYEPTVDVYF